MAEARTIDDVLVVNLQLAKDGAASELEQQACVQIAKARRFFLASIRKLVLAARHAQLCRLTVHLDLETRLLLLEHVNNGSAVRAEGA